MELGKVPGGRANSQGATACSSKVTERRPKKKKGLRGGNGVKNRGVILPVVMREMELEKGDWKKEKKSIKRESQGSTRR